ncbi:MAG: MBL fold metallo-hydrolase [Caldilineaceae bacterium]|nr:MBL fold metallo-hydrolase [Caldilineaceae bacterium]MCY4089226.1 MBL fold metallo-hydrolase [Caldilineaceae bacterium]MCY4117976.1 MBL fold metallo-hydrolase [Caldilineaceae bacterium]MDE0071779.1 MBL fold metallo-hydrolase [Caldilineaceae bacterium]MDE0179965.1 MBL fold metallo-hydrolase [Caldilineaceae bacterium]
MPARRRASFRIGVSGLGERQEIAPGVFINTVYRGCTPGFMVTDEGLILIDTPLIPKQAKDWREQIELEAPGRPILYVFNTDHHRGHALGNQYFLPTTVIAHERAFKEMSGYTENFKERVYNSFKREPDIQEQLTNIEIVLPDVTFTDSARLQYGGREMKLIYVGGHTPATSIAWLPEEKIAFVGDILWVDQHPYMAQADSLEWIDALRRIRSLGAEMLVPGHGPVCGPEDTEKVEEYIQYKRRRVLDYYRAGKTKNEAKSGLVGEMLELFPVPLERKAKIESQIKSGINRVYREIQREEEMASAQLGNGAFAPPAPATVLVREQSADPALMPGTATLPAPTIGQSEQNGGREVEQEAEL